MIAAVIRASVKGRFLVLMAAVALLAAGVQKRIQEQFSGTLRKIRLVPGQFTSVDLPRNQSRHQSAPAVQ